MADGTVGWHFFDAESGLVPEELSPSVLPGGGKGRIVVLAATPLAQAEDWASRAAVAIAENWAQGDLRIFLMDLGLAAPSLHKALGIANREGVSDAFLYGASVQRIAQPALDEAIFFAAAGTATTDPVQILGHPRWTDLAGGFSEADATLLLFLPTDIPGADEILGRATDILFLGGKEEEAESHIGPAFVKVVGMMGPDPFPGEGGEEKTEGLGEDEASETTDFESAVVERIDPVEDLSIGEIPEEVESILVLDQGLRLTEGFAEEVEAEGFAAEVGTGGVSGEIEPDVSEREFVDEGVEGEESGGEAEEGGTDEDDIRPDGQLSDEEPGQGSWPGGDLILEGPDTLLESIAGQEAVTETSEAGLEVGGNEFGDQEPPAPEVPDFGAEFVEMPSLDDEIEATTAEDPARFEGDLVQGSEFTQDQLPDPGPDSGAQDFSEAEEDGDQASADDGRSRPLAPPDGQRTKPKRRPPPKKIFTWGRAVAGLVGLAVVIAAGSTATGRMNVPGFMWLQDWVYEVPEPLLVREGPEPGGPVLRYSLELRTYEPNELAFALEMRNALRDQLPELMFNLARVGEDEMASFALYAGPAAGVVDVENLRAPIAGVMTRFDPESWPIVETPRAFLLEGKETLAEAREYLASVEALGAYGYIVQVTHPDDSEGYEILSGAFMGVEEARGWQLFLRELGFEGVPLVQRRGRPPE